MSTEPRYLIRLRSFDGHTWYCISLDDRTCDCPDFRMMPGRLCKHLNALGIFSKPRPFVPKTHPTFSQALSALVKSIRLRRVEDALYWLIYLDTFKDKASRFRTARRILIGSAEDGHSVAVMEKLADQFSALARLETDVLHLAAEVVRICKVPNWWHPDSGGPDYIYHGMLGHRMMQQWSRENTEQLKQVVIDAIDGKDKARALAAVMGWEVTGFGKTDQALFLQLLAVERNHELANRLTDVHLRAKSALSSDNNFLCQAAWMMAGGESPVALSIEPVLITEVTELLDRVREKWKNPQPIPGWCCDGVHSAGQDERFMGMWFHMYGVCKAFEKYGRVDPSDRWLPEFRCYDGLEIEVLSPMSDSSISAGRK